MNENTLEVETFLDETRANPEEDGPSIDVQYIKLNNVLSSYSCVSMMVGIKLERHSCEGLILSYKQEVIVHYCFVIY